MDLDKLSEKINPRTTALLITDMQRDYCCAGGVIDKMGFDFEIAKRLAPRLNDFVDRARKILKYIVHIKMAHIPELASSVLKEHYERVGLQREYNPSFSEFYGIKPVAGEIVIPKFRYSAFVSTYLDKYLRANSIKTLVLTGVATNVCVESTARDGFMLDYHIVVASDLTEATEAGAKQWSLRNIETFFGEVVNSRKLLDCWGLHGEL